MKKSLLILFLCLIPKAVLSGPVGSESLVSVETHFTFTAADSENPDPANNAVRAFAWCKGGFGLEDNTTTATFESIYPVSGSLRLNGGQLTLGTDLVLQNVISLDSSGYIRGEDHIFELSQSITGFPNAFKTILENTKLFFNSDFTISTSMRFRGNCIIDGRGYRICLDDDGALLVDHGATIHLKNMELDGIKNYKVRNLNDSGRLILDNVRWVQSGDYTFSQGSILIQNEARFVDKYAFYYTTGLTSTIDVDSTWHVADLAKIVMGRRNGIDDREPLYFEDYSAVLRFENSTLNVTTSGMKLSRGTVLCDRELTLDIDAPGHLGGLELGDGTIENDLDFKLFPGAIVNFKNGHITYNIVSADSFLTDDSEVGFVRDNFCIFHSKQDINFKNISLTMKTLTSQVTWDPGKVLDFTNCIFSYSFADFKLTGVSYDGLTQLLNGNDSLHITSGDYITYLRIRNAANTLSGQADISGTIILHHPTTELSVNLDGRILTDVTMNGGKIILDNELRLGRGVMLTGTGHVDVSSHEFRLGSQDLKWTSSISWDADGGSINLNSGLDLYSEWYMTGQCFLDGHNNELKIKDGGKITIGSDSTLHLRNIFVSSLSDYQIECVDDSGVIILDGVRLTQDDSFTFSHGALKFINHNEFSGTSTFFYQSSLTSTIADHSRWVLRDGLWIEMGRKNSIDDREPLYFEDVSSILEVDRANFSITSSGMQLSRGTLEVSNNLELEINSTFSKNGLEMGDGTDDGSFTMRFNPGSLVHFKNGHFIYNNTDPERIKSITPLATARLEPELNVYVEKSFRLKNVSLEFSGLWDITIADGALVDYENCTFKPVGSEFNLTGKRYSQVINLLDGNGSLISKTGTVPLATYVQNTGNTISGFGSIGALVNLIDSSTELTWDVGGIMGADIALAQSIVTLSKPLVFADNKMFLGTGDVNLSNQYVEFGGLDLVANSTVYWDCNSAAMNLRSNLNLTSRWTFSGNCTIQGDGNTFLLSPDGRIVVERGSKLTFKDVVIKGILDGQIYCLEDSSQIILDNSVWYQDANVTFSLGSFKVENKLVMQGRDTEFSYESKAQSQVAERANLILKDDFTFKYAPSSTSRNLLDLEDDTARIILKNATLHSTETGLQLTKGYLEVHGSCRLDSDGSYQAEGIIFGDGVAEANDLKVDIYPESNLDLESGFLVYRNIA